MKHALIITAYSDFNLLAKLIEIYRKYYDCYIHIDVKSHLPATVEKDLKSYDNITVIQKYKVNWGSYRHISAVLQLMKIASAHGPYDFYHVMSANTLIIKSPSEFDAFFQEHVDHNFMEIIDFVGTEQEKDIEEWFAYYHYPFIYNKKGKNEKLWQNFEYYFIKLQKKFGIKRKAQYAFKGYLYCHLSEKFIKYLLIFIKENPCYLKQLKYCHVCEEFFFQNIIMNSEFKDTVINDHLIYDIWSLERGLPAFLDMRDYKALQETSALFARKIDADSEELIKLLCENED